MSPLQQLKRTALDAGWTVSITGGCHLKWQSPDGAIVFTAQTPSDVRAIQNIKRDLRRAGLSV